MVNTLNLLQHHLKTEKDPVEREQLQLSINTLVQAVKCNVKKHNERIERKVEDE